MVNFESKTLPGMTSIVLLATVSPSTLAGELLAAGFQVWEALSVSEVLHLCEHHNVDVVVIAPDVEDAEIVELQLRQTTLTLKPSATAADVMWEITQLFPGRVNRVQ